MFVWVESSAGATQKESPSREFLIRPRQNLVELSLQASLEFGQIRSLITLTSIAHIRVVRECRQEGVEGSPLGRPGH